MTGIPNSSSDLHPALNAGKDSAGVVDALKDKLQIDAEEDEVELEKLSPIVRKRVEVLREIQSLHDALMATFFKERTALEDKYLKLYEPLYTKRYEIINGIAEVEGIEIATNSSEEKGVPEFWLNAMNHNEMLFEEIQERDEKALKYLKDIKWSRIVEPNGFKLEFFFETNPFFKNAVLTKTYHTVHEIDPILKKVVGTEIEWFQGKCLTQKTLIKKPKMGWRHTNPIIKTVDCDSFFNFFKPPEIPADGTYLDDDTADQLQNLLEFDYGIGLLIKDQLIPRAVKLFTGEAVEYE